jgi:hypothetical protein
MTPGQRPHVRVVSSLSQKVGALGLSRSGVLAILLSLHSFLPRDAALARGNRSPTQPNCFFYDRAITDGGYFWHLRFTVGDVGWPTEVWVIDVAATRGNPVS